MAKDPKFAEKLNDTVTHLNSILANVDRAKGLSASWSRIRLSITTPMT